MPVSPREAERLAEAVRDLYLGAERTLLDRVARRLARGLDGPRWAEQKLAEVQDLRREMNHELQQLRAAGDELAPELIGQAYEAGDQAAVRELAEVFSARAVRAAFGVTHEAAVGALARALSGQLASTHQAILRSTQDSYRQVIGEAAGPAVSGARTRREAAQAALNRFADRGITGFVDRSGRHWDLASYAEMATRTAVGRAHVQGHADRLRANDRDLVIVSDSPEECARCRPWEGRVLSLSGRTAGYPTLGRAQAAGLQHPSCTHSTGLYVPGLTRPMPGTANPDGYEERQEQRRLERQVRHWKRREAVALSATEANAARRKVRAWQGELRRFVAEHDRRRQPQREQITSAR